MAERNQNQHPAFVKPQDEALNPANTFQPGMSHMQSCPEGFKSQLCLHGRKRGSIWKKGRQVLPICQMLHTYGHLKPGLLGCAAVKKQEVNPCPLVNQDTAPVHMYKLLRLLKNPESILVAIFRDLSQVKVKAKVGPWSSTVLRCLCWCTEASVPMSHCSSAHQQVNLSLCAPHFLSLKWHNSNVLGRPGGSVG